MVALLGEEALLVRQAGIRLTLIQLGLQAAEEATAMLVRQVILVMLVILVREALRGIVPLVSILAPTMPTIAIPLGM